VPRPSAKAPVNEAVTSTGADSSGVQVTCPASSADVHASSLQSFRCPSHSSGAPGKTCAEASSQSEPSPIRSGGAVQAHTAVAGSP
jgi:hypothetical protein